jgi:hypothetical protein
VNGVINSNGRWPNRRILMHSFQFRSIRSLLAFATFASLLAANSAALAKDRVPEVPTEIEVPAGHKVYYHGYAEGFQKYTWDGVSWGASIPEATLYDKHGRAIAIHYGGPTWESEDGSKVMGVLAAPRVTVDPNAIPWLLLSATSQEGPGLFARATFIHRLNTVGGKAPNEPGTFVGQVAEVPYAADYYFYRKIANGSDH